MDCKTFDEMALPQDLLKGIYAYGFEKPSIIQQKAVVPIIKGFDIIAQSQSGTGKTGAFTIGILGRIEVKEDTQALVLSPTRELAMQTQNVFKALGQNMEVRTQLLIGGTRDNVSRWDKKCHVAIGTPGRVLDYVANKKLDIRNLKVFALDEADEMLSRGFIDQIYDIFQFVPKSSQVVLFSATMPEEIMKITEKFLNNPMHILLKHDELTLEGIQQFYIRLDKYGHKIDTIIDLFEMMTITQSMIYINTKRSALDLHHVLEKEGFCVSLITGDMRQEERNGIIQDFRTGKTRVLLTTDILARGFDVQQVSLVINFDLPKDKETYIHRIGRSGRFGRKGTSINLVTRDEFGYMKEIEKFYNTEIQQLPANIKELI